MTTFIDIFKAKARTKTNTAQDMFALCVYKTMKAKSDDKKTVLYGILRRAFTPGKVCQHRRNPYQTVNQIYTRLNYNLRSGKILNVNIGTIFTEEEAVKFREIFDMYKGDL